MDTRFEGDLAVLGACCRALAATVPRLIRPRRPDDALLASIAHAGLPPARRSVRLTALPQARSVVPAYITAEGKPGPLRLPLGMTTFLVEHDEARFLVDPAICGDVHSRVIADFPSPLRVTIAPEKPAVSLSDALRRRDMRPEDVDFAIPTHLHWDHVSGIVELPPNLPVWVLPEERAFAGAAGDPVPAPLGVSRTVLRDASFTEYALDGPAVATFRHSHDVFGDGSVVLVDLPGHTPGSVGVLLALGEGRRVLLAGDAVWHGLQVSALRQKAPFPGVLVDADRDETFATLHRLHALPAEVAVLPSHDLRAAAPWFPGS